MSIFINFGFHIGGLYAGDVGECLKHALEYLGGQDIMYSLLSRFRKKMICKYRGVGDATNVAVKCQ